METKTVTIKELKDIIKDQNLKNDDEIIIEDGEFYTAKKIKSEVYKKPKDKLYQVRDLLKELIDIGEDYGSFQSAQITHKNLKKAYKLLEGLS